MGRRISWSGGSVGILTCKCWLSASDVNNNSCLNKNNRIKHWWIRANKTIPTNVNIIYHRCLSNKDLFQSVSKILDCGTFSPPTCEGNCEVDTAGHCGLGNGKAENICLKIFVWLCFSEIFCLTIFFWARGRLKKNSGKLFLLGCQVNISTC